MNGYIWVMIHPENSAWGIFPRWYRVPVTKFIPPNKSHFEEAPSAPRPTEQPDSSTWELMVPQGTVSFWERTETPLPLPKLSPKQLSPFPERSELPFPSE